MRIDGHNHPNWYGYTFDRFVQNMDENNIDKTCLISWETPESEHIIGQTWIVSDYLTTGGSPVPAPFSQCIDFKMRAPERFILGYGPDPRNPKAIDLLHSGIMNFDVKICGEIKYRMMYDNPDAIDLFRYAGEQGLPVVLHFDYPEATNRVIYIHGEIGGTAGILIHWKGFLNSARKRIFLDMHLDFGAIFQTMMKDVISLSLQDRLYREEKSNNYWINTRISIATVLPSQRA